jgi:ABC-2 type transport system ATP-binding protein
VSRELAVRARGLSKRFGEVAAVESASLEIPSESFYGLIGPNGAGKSTLISMIVGLLRPDSGTSEIFGYDIWRRARDTKPLIGILPDRLALPERLTGLEALRYLGRMRGVDKAVVQSRAMELMERMDLPVGKDRVIGDYSTGMRKKIGLAIALIHRPRLLVLDEPLEAVDPVSAATISAILRQFVSEGRSVIISSHVMSLVESLCDSVAIVGDGKVLVSGSMAEVTGGLGLSNAFDRAVGVAGVAPERLSWL